MACEETDQYVPQISQPFLWTEDAHSLYLSFLEDAFVNDLYQRHYCALDICGHFPPVTAHTPIAAGCQSPAPPEPPSTPQPSPSSQPVSNVEPKACCKRSHTGSKGSSRKRKGKWLLQDMVLDNQLVCDPIIGLDKGKFSLEQPGSSPQPLENSECLVPKGPCGSVRRSCVKGANERSSGTERWGTDQVVPLAFEEG